MGYDQPERSNSSGAIVAVILAVLLVGFLGLVTVGGVAYFWLSTARMETQEAIVAEERAVAETMLALQPRPIEPGAMGSDPDLTVSVAKDGSMSIDGEQIELSDLRERLVQLKQETGTPVSVLLSADTKCLVEDVDGVRIVSFPHLRTVKHPDHPDMGDELLALAEEGDQRPIVLDLGAIPYIADGLILRDFIELHKRLPEGLVMCNLCRDVREHFAGNRLDQIFRIYDTREEAISAALNE